MKFGSVSASAGGLLTIRALAPGSFECRHLGGGVLVVGGHSGVANQHCIKAPRIELLIPFCNARMQQNRKCPLLQNRSFVQSPNFAGSRETDSAKAHHSGASRRRFDEFIILDAGKVLCKGLFATQPGISSARNCVQPYWGASTFMIQKLREHQHGWDHIERTAVGSAPYLGRKKIYTAPSNSEMLRWLGPMLVRKSLRRLVRRPIIKHWRLAVRSGARLNANSGSAPDLSGFHWIESPKDRFYADPFMIEEGGKAWVFLKTLITRRSAEGLAQHDNARPRPTGLGPASKAVGRTPTQSPV